MTSSLTIKDVVAIALLAIGIASLVAACAAAAWPRRRPVPEDVAGTQARLSTSFAWVVVAGLAYVFLGVAAAVREPRSAGLAAAFLQVFGVLLAAALGGLSLSGGHADESRPSRLSCVGFFVAWLSLIGLPPAVGFHGKLLVYHALLTAGWEWAAAIAMAGSVAVLIPAFLAASHLRPSAASRARAFCLLVLLAAVILLGVYPQAGLAIAESAADLAVGVSARVAMIGGFW